MYSYMKLSLSPNLEHGGCVSAKERSVEQNIWT